MNKIGALGIIAIAVILVFVIAAVAVTVEGAGKAKVTPAKKNVKPVSQPTKQVKTAPTAAATCTDTDNGWDPNVKGTCTDADGTVHNDRCVDGGTVEEFLCNPTDSKNMNGSSTQCGSSWATCGAGKSCLNGACA
jgi:hypothetical protein